MVVAMGSLASGGETVLGPDLDMGEGIYTFPEATRILRSAGDDVSARQVRHWIARGLAVPVHIPNEDYAVLTFDDLVSLEIVRRMKRIGASLQSVRRFSEALRDHYPELAHPFAYRVFFTDGATIWAQIGDDPQAVIELTGRRKGQVAWTSAIQTFASEVRWSNETPAHASGWKLSPWVEIDPEVQFGAPVVTGTRVPVRTIEANLREGTPEEVADWYGLDVRSVHGVRDYLAFA